MHFIKNENGIYISPEFEIIISFLQEIEQEVESLLGFSKKIDNIHNHYRDLLRLTKFLADKLKENDIDYVYNSSIDFEGITDIFKFNSPFRCQLISLFSSLEVLFVINLAYENKTDNEGDLISLAVNEKEIKKFINKFILTDDNKYFLDNKNILKKIDSNKFRKLRNSLVHFFSVPEGGVSISHEDLRSKSRKIENLSKSNKKGNVVFLSEKDIASLIKEANLLVMDSWSYDFKENEALFKEKIKFVINLVEKRAPKIIYERDLNIS